MPSARYEPAISSIELPHIYASDVSATAIDGNYTYFAFGETEASWPWPPNSRGFYITHNDALQSLGLLWTSDRPVAETPT